MTQLCGGGGGGGGVNTVLHWCSGQNILWICSTHRCTDSERTTAIQYLEGEEREINKYDDDDIDSLLFI